MTNTNDKSKNPNFLELGVLWRKQGQKGDFYSGVINLKEVGFEKDVPCVVFVNNNKREGKKDPDLRIYLSQPRDGAFAPAAKTTPAPTAKPAPDAARPVPKTKDTGYINQPEDTDVL